MLKKRDRCKHNFIGRLTFIFFIGVLGYGGVARGATINVPADYGTIQEAVDAANNGDLVLVDTGVYSENINFNGKGITLKSVNGAANTLIDGGGAGSVVKFISGEGADSVLEGFTLTNGSGTLAEYEGIFFKAGAGIFCNGSSPTITNCTISGNSAGKGGGILCADKSSPTITNCIVSSNSANKAGGIYCAESSPTISNCIISSNTATTYSGGGIGSYSKSSPTVINCTITGNTAAQRGGGIKSGGIGSLTLSNCTISGNSTGTDGGGIASSGRSNKPTLINCSINNNTATRKGGGIFSISASRPKVTNCTISGNTAERSGGILCDDNSSSRVVNSIFWGNNPDEIGLAGSISFITIAYSDVQGGDPDNPGFPYPGVGNIDADPKFVGGGDYRLVAGSPCINKGTDNTVTYPTLPNDDIEGDARPQMVKYDMGADEFVCPDTNDSDGDGVGDDCDNCVFKANTDQRDTDGDGYGNACDGDFNNDYTVNSLDLGLFRGRFMTTDPDADFNGDGTVNSLDLGLFRGMFMQPPGPSAFAP